jgi:hypothetical protein
MKATHQHWHVTSILMGLEPWWIRVPLWSLWYPLVVIPDFVVDALCHGAWRRMLQAECWRNLWCFFLVGLDGWGEYE